MKEWICEEVPAVTIDGEPISTILHQIQELVRCKDCEHGDILCADYVSCLISDENESGCHVSHNENWFCADGVAKDINVHNKEGR